MCVLFCCPLGEPEVLYCLTNGTAALFSHPCLFSFFILSIICFFIPLGGIIFLAYRLCWPNSSTSSCNFFLLILFFFPSFWHGRRTCTAAVAVAAVVFLSSTVPSYYDCTCTQQYSPCFSFFPFSLSFVEFIHFLSELSLLLFHSSFFLVFSLSFSLYFAWMVQINLPHFKEPSSFFTASSLWVLLTHVSAAAVISATVLGGGGGEGKRMLTTAKTMLTTWNNFSAIFFCEVFFSFCFQKVVLPLD